MDPHRPTPCVRVFCNERGDLIVHPVRAERGEALLPALRSLGEVDDAFVAALQAEREAPVPTQEREAL